jgi:hypothetical protein
LHCSQSRADWNSKQASSNILCEVVIQNYHSFFIVCILTTCELCFYWFQLKTSQKEGGVVYALSLLLLLLVVLALTQTDGGDKGMLWKAWEQWDDDKGDGTSLLQKKDFS